MQSEQNEKRGNLDELNTEVAGKPAEPRIESSGDVGAEKPAEIITGKKKPIDHTAVAMTGEHGLMVDRPGLMEWTTNSPKAMSHSPPNKAQREGTASVRQEAT